MNSVRQYVFLISVAFVVTSCSYNRSPEGNYDPNDPGYVYAPDMYYSVPYEPLSQNEDGGGNKYNKFGMTMREPVKGTIARGKLDYVYPYPNTPEGYEMAAQLKNPLKPTEENILKGKQLYETYCDHCHGKTGSSEGPVMASGKFPKPHFGKFNSDYIRNLPDGKKFHTITYGKNLMGSHASQVSPHERWLIILYIDRLSMGEAAVQNTGSDVSNGSPSSTVDSTSTDSQNGTMQDDQEGGNVDSSNNDISKTE